jgi:hypothetical protein
VALRPDAGAVEMVHLQLALAPAAALAAMARAPQGGGTCAAPRLGRAARRRVRLCPSLAVEHRPMLPAVGAARHRIARTAAAVRQAIRARAHDGRHA